MCGRFFKSFSKGIRICSKQSSHTNVYFFVFFTFVYNFGRDRQKWNFHHLCRITGNNSSQFCKCNEASTIPQDVFSIRKPNIYILKCLFFINKSSLLLFRKNFFFRLYRKMLYKIELGYRIVITRLGLYYIFYSPCRWNMLQIELYNMIIVFYDFNIFTWICWLYEETTPNSKCSQSCLMLF